MTAYEIAPELNLKKIVAEVKEFAKAMNEFANDLEQIEKKYADGIPKETVTEFADRCRECGERYGRLLNQKWIPVSERLPEDKTYVLTTIKVPNRIAHARSGWYEGGLFHNDNGDTWKATDMEVKAWMPLPEPYNAESEEKK